MDKDLNHDNRKKGLQKPYILSDKEIKEISERNPKMERIYHYTSVDTFYKLIESIKDDCFTFRAGSVYTMNDTQEMILGYNKIKKYLPIIEEQLKVPQEERLLNLVKNRKKNKSIVDKFGEWMINDDTTNFVISFSAAPDILPMWTLYGSNGTGICLEFSPYVIKNYYKQTLKNEKFQIEKCVYTETDIEKFMLNNLKVVYKSFFKRNDNRRRNDPNIKAQDLATLCGVICAFVKHVGFEYEQEIRMNVFKRIEDWKFDISRNGHHIVYADVPIPINALKGIIVGPAAEMDKVNNTIKMILRTKGIRIEPTQSRIPFRNY